MVNFYLENRTNKKQEAVIRVSIAIRGARLVTSTGYNIKPADWNAERHEVKPRKENWKKQTTYDINTALGDIRRHFDTYEKDHGEVTEEELRKEFKTFMGRVEVKEEILAATEKPKEPTFTLRPGIRRLALICSRNPSSASISIIIAQILIRGK